MIRILLAGLAACLMGSAATRSEYRGFWVDTFNSNLNTPADVAAVVNAAKAAKANALFTQVRRRGDAWYLNSWEPAPDFIPIAPGFDPLQSLIEQAHAVGIEVHAFVIMGAIWNKNPTFAPSATLGPPVTPWHVFNLHSGFDAASSRIETSANNWLTRSLLPDGTAGLTFQGHRVGAEFWLDFGHPDAASYSVDVVMHLVRNYAIDGLHLDRIRYPDLAATGQTPTTGANIGYNPVSVWRFQQRYGIAQDGPPPSPGDERWAQWRRDQVTNVVRRIYLNAMAIRPELVVSAAVIVFGDGPSSEAQWPSVEAYWRVYQDWRAWLEEGIIDLALPMNYKREAIAQQAGWYDRWNEFTRNHQYGRASAAGLGVYLNSIEGTLRQTRRALAPSEATGRSMAGVVFYAIANPDTAVDNNPHALPAGSNTPVRGIAEFAAALTTGKYESAGEAVFAEDAVVPRFEWKRRPSAGHLMGTARGMDAAVVTVYNSEGRVERVTATDGSGFFGVVDLKPGEYVVVVESGRTRLVSQTVAVVPGVVGIVGFRD